MTEQAATRDTLPLVIGHRGASAAAPENTLASFERALRDGADGLEFDVRLAADGVPVVIHDATLRRTAGLDATLAALSSSSLGDVDVGSWFNRRFPARACPEYERERVPTLARVLELFAPRCRALYVEIKCDPADAHAHARAVAGLLRADAHAARCAVVESFTLEAIAEVKRLAPGVRTAALFERTLRHPHATAVALVERATAHGADELALHRSMVTRRAVEAARAADLSVAVWTVDHLAWAARARELGLRALITNRPARLRSALDAISGRAGITHGRDTAGESSR